METIDLKSPTFPFSEISDKEVTRMAGRKKFLGDYQGIQFKIPEAWIPLFEQLQTADSSMNKNKIIRIALEKYFQSLPELRKQKRAS